MNTDQLNPEQKQAVDHVEGPLLVIAGAGSGKTRVVTFRIARLLEQGVLPTDILAVTFTNKAADVMRERIEMLQGKKITACTFHSLGARILRESISSLGYSKDFTIYDEEDSENALKACAQTLVGSEEKGFIKNARMFISGAKNNLLDPVEIRAHSMDAPLYADLYAKYQAKLKDANAVDFDDLLFLTVKLLQTDEKALLEYQNRWLFLLIDEYQDTNLAQYTLAKLITQKHNNIFAVGDPDQSIYSWRGARYQNILNFKSDFPGAKIITLEQNYRSTRTILQAANELIAHNQNRYEKNLWSDLETGDKIGLYFAANEKREADFIVEKISENAKNKVPFNEMAIFYRTNAQSRNFEDSLLRNRIPYQIIGGVSFYQRREIKDLLSFARVALLGADFLSFSRTISLPKRGIGPVIVKKIIDEAEKRKQTLLPFCRDLLQGNVSDIKLSAKQKEGMQDYLDVIQKLQTVLQNTSSIQNFLNDAIVHTRYLEYLKEDPESYEDRKENLEALISKAAEWEEESESPTLAKFLDELTLKSHKETEDLPSLKLMTLHNSKGLEFGIVFVTGLEEDVLPHANMKENMADIEEERRLLYVGMTRAMKFLYLTLTQSRFLWGIVRPMQPSRFIKEIPSEYIHYYSVAQPTDFSEDSGFQFSPGQRVMHNEFGIGTVEKAYRTSYGVTYDVFFEEDSISRSLIAKYAKLQPFN
ncbi:MAG TPA: UvrD-helicase domain-containing protein [Chlamydiales bacterium]|nr:UvrD-helicase domain-containing protein [Chlamydiales bacterium]